MEIYSQVIWRARIKSVQLISSWNQLVNFHGKQILMWGQINAVWFRDGASKFILQKNCEIRLQTALDWNVISSGESLQGAFLGSKICLFKVFGCHLKETEMLGHYKVLLYP